MVKFEGLVDRHGRPIEKPVLTTEIAGPSITGVRSPITGYPGNGLNPVRLAGILRDADGGDPVRALELAETVEERDPHIVGVLGTRKRSVAQLEITVEDGSDKAPKEHAERVREWLKRDELAEELFHVLDAIHKGYSFTEIMWDTSSGQWTPARLEWRDPRWFDFDRRDLATPQLIGDGGDRQALPGGKFIFARLQSKSGIPTRSGLSRPLAWLWMFKAFTTRDWAIFTQTFGQPIRLGKYGPGTSQQDRDTLYRAIANVAGDMAAMIPASMSLEFIQAEGVTGNSTLFQDRADWLDQQASKAVLGQTATTDAVTGGLGSGKEHRQVQEDIERADSKALSAILNRDLVQVWIDLEFGPQEVYPKLRIGRPDVKDVTQVTGAVSSLGLPVKKSEIYDLVGFSIPAAGDEVFVPRGAAETATPAGVGDAEGPVRTPPAGRAQALQAERTPRADYAIVLRRRAVAPQSEHYDPNQPRVPRGVPIGGEWTDDPAYGGDGRPGNGGQRGEPAPDGVEDYHNVRDIAAATAEAIEARLTAEIEPGLPDGYSLAVDVGSSNKSISTYLRLNVFDAEGRPVGEEYTIRISDHEAMSYNPAGNYEIATDPHHASAMTLIDVADVTDPTDGAYLGSRADIGPAVNGALHAVQRHVAGVTGVAVQLAATPAPFENRYSKPILMPEWSPPAEENGDESPPAGARSQAQRDRADLIRQEMTRRYGGADGGKRGRIRAAGFKDEKAARTALIAELGLDRLSDAEVGKRLAAAAQPALNAEQTAADEAECEQQFVDVLSGQAGVLAGGAMDEVLELIADIVARSSTLEEVRGKLLTIAPTIPTKALASALRQAQLVARLSGRASLADG